MKTLKGTSFCELLAVKVEKGTLYTGLVVPGTLGDIGPNDTEAIAQAISERIMAEKKPGATFDKCLQRIEHHREQLRDAYVTLFETYQRMITPTVRQNGADKAYYAMLDKMDDKMLRAFGLGLLSETLVYDYVLPDDREIFCNAIVAKMKE